MAWECHFKENVRYAIELRLSDAGETALIRHTCREQREAMADLAYGQSRDRESMLFSDALECYEFQHSELLPHQFAQLFEPLSSVAIPSRLSRDGSGIQR